MSNHFGDETGRRVHHVRHTEALYEQPKINYNLHVLLVKVTVEEKEARYNVEYDCIDEQVVLVKLVPSQEHVLHVRRANEGADESEHSSECELRRRRVYIAVIIDVLALELAHFFQVEWNAVGLADDSNTCEHKVQARHIKVTTLEPEENAGTFILL